MDKAERIAILLTRIERCACERAAMIAMNEKRADQGYAQAYGEEAFCDLPNKHQLDEALVREFLGW